MPQLEILVSAMNQATPQSVVKKLNIQDDSVHVLIVNQCTTIAPPSTYDDGRIRMYSFLEKGLSRSRNRLLENARGDICLIADDDISYLPGFPEKVIAAYKEWPDAAVVTFQYRMHGAGMPAKKYPSKEKRHSRFSAARVASIEITLRPALLRGIKFDEKFGLGTGFPTGGESIFMLDMYRAGVPCYYVPSVICVHDGEPTGWKKVVTKHDAIVIGCVYKRMYPKIWPIAAIASVVGLRRVRNKMIGPCEWFLSVCEGALCGCAK